MKACDWRIVPTPCWARNRTGCALSDDVATTLAARKCSSRGSYPRGVNASVQPSEVCADQRVLGVGDCDDRVSEQTCT